MKTRAWKWGGLFAGLLVVATFVAQLQSSETEQLSNYQGTFQCSPGTIVDPQNIEEIQDVVQQAVLNGKHVMTGNRGFASQIDAACTLDGDIQITLKNMNQLIEVNEDAKTMTVQAGMRFKEFNRIARSHGLAVNMVTELGTFTIGGMLGSGTHGSTLQNPHNMLSDYVTSMKLVDGMGAVRTLSGSDLDAARVNIGVLGVVVEVTIQMEDLFKVRAAYKGYRDGDLETNVLELARNNFSANVAWFPGLGKYTATTYNPVPVETPGNAYNAQAEISGIQAFFFPLLFKASQEVSGTWLQGIAAGARYYMRTHSYFRDTDSGEIVQDPVGYSDVVQYFECAPGEDCPWLILPIALHEIAIPLEDLPAWIADVRGIIDANPKTYFPLNGIYFRFGRASKSYLGMSAGRDTVFIGVEYALRARGEHPAKNYFVTSEIEQLTLFKYQGRPHWGKNTVAVFKNTPERFPKWNDFAEVKKRFDPLDVFVNPFWKRARGDIPVETLTPNCATKGLCYCRTDEHCEQGQSCRDGAFYTEARVCR